MKNEITENTALMVIDVQKGFDNPKWGIRNNLNAEANIAKLIQLWRSKQRPVIHIQHCSTEADSPLRLGQSGCEFKSEVTPLESEIVFQKSVNSAFIGTNLESHLHENEIKDLIIVGLTTDHCISTTTRMAGNLGFNVILLSDATATFDRNGEDGSYYTADQIHKVHLASLNGEFCTVKTCVELLNQDSKEA